MHSGSDNPSNERAEREAVRAHGAAEAGRIAAARSVLAAIDTSVFATRKKQTRGEHRSHLALAVGEFFARG